MLAFIDDGVVLRQERRFHFQGEGPEDYAAFVRPMEERLAKSGLALEPWDPAEEIPPEFLVAKAADDGRRRRPPRKARLKPFPGAPKGSLCAMKPADVDGLLSRWHDFVLEEMAGAADTEESTAAPIVWRWHAHLARTRRNYRACASSRKPASRS